MKKLIALIMSIIIVFASTVFAIAGSSVKGDTNGDGVVTSTDALEVLRFSVGIISNIDKTAADVNSDGNVNSSDALEVLKIVVGLVDPTNTETPIIDAQIIEYFNKAANDAKSNSKSITQLYCINSLVSISEINNKTIKNLAETIISKDMGEDMAKKNVTYTSTADKNKNFPVSNQTWSSKLTASDVKSVTKTSNGNIDTVTLKLIDDTTPNITPGNGHAGKAFSIITKDQIIDGAGSTGTSFIKEDSIQLTFKDCRITASIDSTTGKLQTINYYQTWTLSLSTKITPLDITVSFGLEEAFKINW